MTLSACATKLPGKRKRNGTAVPPPHPYQPHPDPLPLHRRMHLRRMQAGIRPSAPRKALRFSKLRRFRRESSFQHPSGGVTDKDRSKLVSSILRVQCPLHWMVRSVKLEWRPFDQKIKRSRMGPFGGPLPGGAPVGRNTVYWWQCAKFHLYVVCKISAYSPVNCTEIREALCT